MAPSSTRSRRAKLIAFVAGVMAVVGIGGSSAAYAYWTSSAAALGQVQTFSVKLSTDGFPSLSATYLNSNLTSTGSFTVTNGGVFDGTLTLSASSADAFAAKYPVRIWPVDSASACTSTSTVPSTAVSGTWGSVSIASGTNLAAGATQRYCARTSLPLADRQTLASTAGSVTVQPQLQASLQSIGWTVNATQTVNTQKTVAIYPLTTNYYPADKSHFYMIRPGTDNGLCLDVEYGGGANSRVISYPCTGNANQSWQIVPVSAGDATYVTLRPRYQPDTRAAVGSDGTVRIQNTDAAALSQRWRVQYVEATARYQLVSDVDGRCLTMPTTVGQQTSVTTCDQANVTVELVRQPLTFAGTSATTGTISMPGGYYTPNLTVQWRASAAAAWSNVGTLSASQTSLNVTTSQTMQVRVLFSNGNIAYDGIVITSGGAQLVGSSGFG